jgi:pyruvate dehydrogenase E1 component
MGAVLPEAIKAIARIGEQTARAGLLVVTSPDRLHRGWVVYGAHSHADKLLAPSARDVTLATLLDGHPLTLSWLGAVRGQRTVPLGVANFRAA